MEGVAVVVCVEEVEADAEAERQWAGVEERQVVGEEVGVVALEELPSGLLVLVSANPVGVEYGVDELESEGLRVIEGLELEDPV